MFAQLGLWLSTFLDGYVAGVVGTVAAALRPIAVIWLTVYIANYGYAVTRGEASDPFSTFAWKMVKMMFIMALALSAGTFMNVVFTTANGLQDGMATIFLRSGPERITKPPFRLWRASVTLRSERRSLTGSISSSHSLKPTKPNITQSVHLILLQRSNMRWRNVA